MSKYSLKKSLKLFVMPVGLILIFELVVRFGVWEPLLKPNSHAYFSKQSKNFFQVFNDNNINAITLGDSRARIGINHGTVTEVQKQLGKNHLNMTMNRSHLTTFKAVTDWMQSNVNNFDTVIIAMSKTGLLKAHYGPFELAKTQPFQPWYRWKKTNTYDEVGHKNGLIQKVANRSALVAYRKDIRDLLKNPIKRFQSLKSSSTEQNVYSNIGAEENICGIDLSSINTCQKNTSHPSLNQGRQNVLKRYCQGELALSIQNHGQQRLTTKEIQTTVSYWTQYLEELTQNNIQVVMVWLPDHHLIQQDLSYSNENLVYDNMINLIKNTQEITALDLSDLFDEQEKSACHYFYEPVHPNKYGAELITRKLTDFISRKSSQ